MVDLETVFIYKGILLLRERPGSLVATVKH